MKANEQTLIVEFKDLSSIEKDLLLLPKHKAVESRIKNVIYFDTLISFRNFMTIQKIEILTFIADKKPKSIYELSKMLDRAIAPVQKDCQMLEASGFITLDKKKVGRGTLTPKLVFPYCSILVKLPEHSYELQFKAA